VVYQGTMVRIFTAFLLVALFSCTINGNSMGTVVSRQVVESADVDPVTSATFQIVFWTCVVLLLAIGYAVAVLVRMPLEMDSLLYVDKAPSR